MEYHYGPSSWIHRIYRKRFMVYAISVIRLQYLTFPIKKNIRLQNYYGPSSRIQNLIFFFTIKNNLIGLKNLDRKKILLLKLILLRQKKTQITAIFYHRRTYGYNENPS